VTDRAQLKTEHMLYLVFAWMLAVLRRARVKLGHATLWHDSCHIL